MSFESQSDCAIIFLYPIPENVGEKKSLSTRCEIGKWKARRPKVNVLHVLLKFSHGWIFC